MAMVKIYTEESPEMVHYVLKNIVNAIKQPNTNWTPMPGIRYFRKLEGKQDNHIFTVEHIPQTKRSEPEQLYAAFDDYEFISELNGLVWSYFMTIENHINKNYIYDINTDTYVLRPKAPDALTIIKQWINNNIIKKR